MSAPSKSFFPAWLRPPEDGGRIAVSSRIRLARNFADLSFPHAAADKEKSKVLERVEQFVLARPDLKFSLRRLAEMDDIRRGVLAERSLINLETAREPEMRGLATGPGQVVSMLLNEEDHFRIQVLAPGLDLTKTLYHARQLDEALGRHFQLAVSEEFGFLTACPTNVGTGLRASVMLHLPGLTLTRGIVQVLQAVLHMGLAVRGFYGEGTELRSVYYQISNQVTLGRSEDEIISHLLGVTRQIIGREEEARQKLVKENRRLLEDKIGRALGILKGCRLLAFEEALDLLSTVRLGVEIGLLAEIQNAWLSELQILVQPAHLLLLANKPLSAEAQMAKRADLVKRRLKLGPAARKRKKTPRR